MAKKRVGMMAAAHSERQPTTKMAEVSLDPQKYRSELMAPETSNAPMKRFFLPNFLLSGLVMAAPTIEAIIRAVMYPPANNWLWM